MQLCLNLSISIVHPGINVKILNGHNFISVYAANTEQTSLCYICSGASSAVVLFLSQPVTSHIFNRWHGNASF